MSNPNATWATATENLSTEIRSEIARIAASRKWAERNRDKLLTLRGEVRRIIEARLDRCMSQQGAAREMGISSVTLSRIENGRTSVNEELMALAIAWAVAPNERDGLQSARGELPKPRWQRPLRTDPKPDVFDLPPEPPRPPALLISKACPYWSTGDIAITEATCEDTRFNGIQTCRGCAGIKAISSVAC